MTSYNGNHSLGYGFNHHGAPIRAGHLDARYRRQRVRRERRTTQGVLTPSLYLMLEITLMLIVIYSVAQFHLVWLTIIAAGIAVYFLATSSLPRFQMVLRRQQNT